MPAVPVLSADGCPGIYGPKVDIRTVTAADMIEVFTVNCIGPLLVVQQLAEAGLIGGMGGKTLVANMSSKVRTAVAGSTWRVCEQAHVYDM